MCIKILIFNQRSETVIFVLTLIRFYNCMDYAQFIILVECMQLKNTVCLKSSKDVKELDYCTDKLVLKTASKMINMQTVGFVSINVNKFVFLFTILFTFLITLPIA